MRLSTKYTIFEFSGDNPPALTVATPTSIDIETMDCFSNQLREPTDTVDQLDWDRVNPATGPIFIEGAEPGDTLKVVINSIKLDSRGTVCCLENEGILGHMIEGSHLRIVPVQDGEAVYLDNMKIPLRKMIGVIGVAPAEGGISNGTPGHHGGNMDTPMITEGATLYLPVSVPGALLAMGDVHAVMGDGEIGVSGLEIPAEVNVTIDIVKGKTMDYPWLENEDSFAVIVSKETVDEAIDRSTELMCEFLEERMDISRPEIIMLMSMVGNVEISQVVDPEKTVRFVFPKKYIKNAQF